MNVFYEEDGGFKAGNVLSDQGASVQVESASGKRSKVKSGHVLFDFEKPDAVTLMRDAQQLADGIDLEFLWECAPQAEFSFRDLATDYFGRAATAVESAALITRLHSAPMYFYRKGRGQYRPAPPDALKAALAGIERKRREAALQGELRDELVAGVLPESLLPLVRELLFRPDRNKPEYKALIEAASARMTTPERLLLDVGGFPSAAALHRERFVFEQFPRGTGFSDVAVPAGDDALPLAGVEAFSIDDAQTTEIDDALSVEGIGEGRWRIGVHIAAPGLAVKRDEPIDVVAHERYSTVYSPGEKITMLPDAVVAAFTLAAGRACPVLSLYVDAVEEPAVAGDEIVDEAAAIDRIASTWRIVDTHSRIERIMIADNLRHDDLEDRVTTAALEGAAPDGATDFPRKPELSVLWRFARALNGKRQQARIASGLRPERNQRSDYNFRVEQVGGEDHVVISERRRGAPLDTIVAELMILANSTWGKLLADRGVAGIYRAQSGAFGPAGRVRMITHPAPHVGLGVAQYAWSTSPLRRYVDLVNQWQIASCIEGGGAAPFARKDAELFGIVSGFDAAYAAYAEYQSKMERYWCLRWLQQQDRSLFEARATGRDDNAVLVDIPLPIRVPGMAVGGVPGATTVVRGQRIEVEIVAIDLVDLSVQCRLLTIIEEVDAAELDEAGSTEGTEAEAGTDADPAAALAEVASTAVDAETVAAEADDPAVVAFPPG
jgi:exoribonuclease-2